MYSDWVQFGQGFLNAADFLERFKHQTDEELDHNCRVFVGHLEFADMQLRMGEHVNDVVLAAYRASRLALDEINASNPGNDFAAVRDTLKSVSELCKIPFREIGEQIIAASLRPAPTPRQQNEQRIWNALETVARIDVVDKTLKDAATEISRLFDVPLLVETEALVEVGITGDEVISYGHHASLRSMLNTLLKCVNGVELGWTVENETLWITTLERMWEVHPETRPEAWEFRARITADRRFSSGVRVGQSFLEACDILEDLERCDDAQFLEQWQELVKFLLGYKDYYLSLETPRELDRKCYLAVCGAMDEIESTIVPNVTTWPEARACAASLTVKCVNTLRTLGDQIIAATLLAIPGNDVIEGQLGSEEISRPQSRSDSTKGGNPLNPDNQSDSHPNGPDELDGYFWWDDQRIDTTLGPTAWRLLKFLWFKRERKAEIGELGAPVWRDPEKPIAREDVKQPAFDIRQFFRKHQIPLRCSQRKPHVMIEAVCESVSKKKPDSSA